jgi:tRNA(Ile)-lysidine synthase
MSHLSPAHEFVAKLTAAWPAEQWRDVHVVVAVSGGADSMALLRGLLDVKRQAGGAGRIHAAHVNHQLRGDDSGADAEWLCQQCERLETPLTVQCCDVAALASEQGDGVEAAARAARYRLLTAAAESIGARFVALGHTADDQAETILFRLLRGTGLRGLAGIPARRRLSPSVSAVRPMLGLRRGEVLQYLQAIGQGCREDASNVDSRFARNRVRHELLPRLRESFNRDVGASLVRLGALAEEAQGVIEDLSEELLGQCRRDSPDGDGIVLATGPLKASREILVCEVLRRAWREAGFAEQGMTRMWWQQLAQFAQSPVKGGALNLPGNVLATRPVAGVLAMTSAGLP